MRIYNKRFIISRNWRHDRCCADCIDKCMWFDICNHFWSYLCIHTNVNSKTFCLLCHRQNCCFHLCFSRSFSCCQKLSAKCVCCLTKDRVMSSLLQNDSCFKSTDSTTSDQNFLWFLCRNEFTFFLSSDCRVTKTSDARRIFALKSIIASLVTSNTVVDFFCFSGFCLVTEIRIYKLSTSNHNHIYLVIFQNLFCKLWCIDSSDTDCQHSCFLTDLCSIVNVKCSWNINRRYLVFETC